MPDVLSRKTVRARKQHTCMTCHNVAVQPGQEYERTTLVYDGRIYDWVNCPACETAAPYVFKWVGDYGDEGISEDTYEEWAMDAGWNARSTDPADQNDEQKAALAFLVRYRKMIVDHRYTSVAGHPDDPECAHRSDGTDATYCGQSEHMHLWSDR